MLGNSYENQNCSAARALEVVGERWSLLIIRDALFRGATRFSDFERGLGIATNVLAKRLDSFVAAGLLQRQTGDRQDEPQRYVPTEKCMDLKPVILALTAWGDRWAAPDGPPITFRHEGCGGQVSLRMHCNECRDAPMSGEVVAISNRRERRRPDPATPAAKRR